MTRSVILVCAVGLTLIGALALGWNSPRPGRSPDWEAASLPRRVEAGADDACVSLLGRPSSDFTLEIVVVPLRNQDSGEYGLVYRAQDPRHHYVFAVGSDGYYTVIRRDGEDVTPLVAWQQFPHVRRGRRSNRLLVTCAGRSCTFRINDEHAATIEDDTWLSGDVGLWARGLEEPTEVAFSAVRLWSAEG